MRSIVAFLLLAVISVRAVDFGTNASGRVVGVVPFASTTGFARSNNIPLGKIDPLLSGDVVKPGDSVTVLVTITEKGGQRAQWLLYTRIAGEPAASNGVMVIHNTFGNRFEFPSHPTAVSLRTLGPFVEGAAKTKVKDEKAKFSLDKGYLGLGLDHAAAAVARLDAGKKRKGSFRSGTVKFSDEDIKDSKEFAAEWKLTAAEERALGGTYPALTSYFDIVQHTQSLESILSEVIDRPSLWSLAANLGISSIEFNWQGARRSPLPAAAWGMADEIPIYEIPMVLMLNKHPSLNITLIVTAPRPPLLTSAGILGVLGEKPGKPEPYLTIRIINAKLAPRAIASGSGR
jgi:hypothetical protein